MNNIEKILNELYIVDPSFKSREGEIRNIIQELLKSKPEIKIDENFITRLREQLQSSARAQEAGFGERRPSWKTVFGKRIGLVFGGGLVSLFIILAVMMPALRKSGISNIPAGDDIVVIDEERTVTEDDNGGIIVKKDDGAGEEKIVAGFVKFESEKEFKDYLALAESGYYYGGMGMVTGGRAEMGMSMDAKTTAPSFAPTEPERFSETNVQVKGIDEPDIVKTNGKEIYLSSSGYYGPMSIIFNETTEEPSEIGGTGILPLPPEYDQPKTKIIKAFPADDLAEKGAIARNGNLLLKDNILTVLENNNLFGYDVTNPDSPKEKWAINLKDNNSIVQARLYNGKIYLVTGAWVNQTKPCPVPLFAQDGKIVSVDCSDIYHPKTPVPSETVYNISTVDMATGNVTRGISFVGSYNPTIYMSQNAVYVAYSYNSDQFELYYDFFKESGGLIPGWMMERFAKVKEYDLSQQAKMAEFETIMNEFRRSLSNDDSLKFENEMENKMSDYVKKHKRDLVKTDIVKINIDNLKVETIGIIPGNLLNQFSLDEYEKNLRVAVTVGENFWLGGRGARIESENDVYVLDKNLKIIGLARGLGAGERIYSARFLGDKGYLVTFRQTDPFYVLDLGDPRNPQVKGELKIPGYSSYLDPIAENRILGIGKEGSEVKISLFDVSSPANPREVSKYILKEYWSDILDTHHAFLSDEKHKIFFLPGNNGGYVFSYENDSLTLKKAVSGIQTKRALFINDYLYVIGSNKIIVLNETGWETINELAF